MSLAEDILRKIAEDAIEHGGFFFLASDGVVADSVLMEISFIYLTQEEADYMRALRREIEGE